MIEKKDEITKMFAEFFGTPPQIIQELPPSGSNRYYYRLQANTISAIATYNPDRTENDAFLYITDKLKTAGVNVPEIYDFDPVNCIYLQEDLGTEMLFDKIESCRQEGNQVNEWKMFQ